MKVFFTASYKGKAKYQDAYDATVLALRKRNIEVISLEVQKYEDVIGKTASLRMSDSEKHYLYIKKGMDKSNAVIIEASQDNFQLGHEATLALLFNKPVLCLSQNKDYSDRIKHQNFYAKTYSNLNELEETINNFLDLIKNKLLSVRFNMYLTPEQKNFLDWQGQRLNKNTAEIIRGLVDDLKKNTPEYENDIVRYLPTWKY